MSDPELDEVLFDVSVEALELLLPLFLLPPPLPPYPSAYHPPPLREKEVAEIRRSSLSSLQLGQVTNASSAIRWSAMSSCPQA